MNKQLKNDEDAQVGIGTMIVFIATILVAAVAAGVLIDTSQKLSDKSVRTGNDATENVGTSIEVLRVYGVRDLLDDSASGTPDGELDGCVGECNLAGGGSPTECDDPADNCPVGDDDAPQEDLDFIKVQVRLAAGASSIDVGDLVVQFEDGTSAGFATYTQGDPTEITGSPGKFGAAWLVGDDTNGIMDAGEIVELTFGDYDADRTTSGTPAVEAFDADIDIATGQLIELKFLPEVGQAVKVAFTTPVTFGNEKVFNLF